MAAALELKPDEIVVEVGAGHGELTDELRTMSYELRILAIEKDSELVAFLEKKFSGDKNIEILKGDVLKILSSTIHHSLSMTQNYKLVGNIPYYLTGYLLRLIGELEHKPDLCVFTVQKEVAERMVAEPPSMNRLAASVQFWAEPEILEVVSRGHFSPPPAVDSVLIKLKVLPRRQINKSEKLQTSERDYYKMVRILFQQPRKTILNNLLVETNKQNREKVLIQLEKLEIKPGLRPQDLNIGQITTLSEVFKF